MPAQQGAELPEQVPQVAAADGCAVVRTWGYGARDTRMMKAT